MTSRAEREKSKLIQDKCQTILGQLLREEDNKYCVDCDAKGPRWASWNLGIFLCIRCAGIHRNLGVHISRVKSVNLDSWTPEQIACLQHMGNSKARAVYEANLPDAFRRPQSDSSLEQFIRNKYEHKKYIAKEWVQPPMPPPAFDVEEETRKHRESRKAAAAAPPPAKAPPTTTVSNDKSALPRPKSNSNLGDLTSSQTSVPKTSGAAADLLGLDLSGGAAAVQASSATGMGSPSDDPFQEFLSAPPVGSNLQHAPVIATTVDDGSKAGNGEGREGEKSPNTEEREFFSQKAPEKATIAPLTKTDIMSLYGPAPAATAPTNAGMYGMPMGIGTNGTGTGFPNAVPFTAVQPPNPMMMNGGSAAMMGPAAGPNPFLGGVACAQPVVSPQNAFAPPMMMTQQNMAAFGSQQSQSSSGGNVAGDADNLIGFDGKAMLHLLSQGAPQARNQVPTVNPTPASMYYCAAPFARPTAYGYGAAPRVTTNPTVNPNIVSTNPFLRDPSQDSAAMQLSQQMASLQLSAAAGGPAAAIFGQGVGGPASWPAAATGWPAAAAAPVQPSGATLANNLWQ